jgi:hypothetical protein
MAQKKTTHKKSVKKPTRGPKPAPKKISRKPVRKAKTARAKKPARKKKVPLKRRSGRRGTEESFVRAIPQQGLGARSGGQSGDIEGLSGIADADSESVEELLEEGQSFEAEVVRGVENAADPDESEVTTEEIPEDDVPPEYGGEQ